MFAVLGAGALIIAQNYEAGNASRFGPGMVPRLLGACLLIGGIAVIARGFLSHGDRIERWILRPNIFVLLSVLAFGLLIEHTGLILATIVITVIARCAQQAYQVRWIETAVLAVGLAAFGAIAFVKSLELPIPLWPG
ncbi:MAG: tripartite tricarboxylate transporter TctB family protein [Rhodospirillales bacterium]